MQAEFLIWGVLLVLGVLATLGHFAFRDLIAAQNAERERAKKADQEEH